MSDLISRQDAIEGVKELFACADIGNDEYDITYMLENLPSADRPTTDCTKFVEWLKAEVLDEENWELNAVANGEIICRKLKKLGWLDVEDGYYVDTRATGEWIKKTLLKDTVYDLHVYKCSCCGVWGKLKFNYCPNCGAKMKEREKDD